MPETKSISQNVNSSKLRVFLSYSRKDVEFASELLSALELLGFDAFLDKEDIAPGEPWEERLSNLIRIADTVVFIVSPASSISKHCNWELEETIRNAKRLVPVILSEVPAGEVPDQLRRLNFIFFSHGRSFSKALAELAQALRQNTNWIREHTRIGEMALRWQERGQPQPLLLRGSDLEDALTWMAKRPEDAPQITALQDAYLRAGQTAAADDLAQKASLRWRVQIGLAIATATCLSAALIAGWNWKLANDAKTELAAKNEALIESNIRLSRPIALRIAPLGEKPYDVRGNWYEAATTFSGAIAFVSHDNNPDRTPASGVIVDAKALHPAWKSEPLFITAASVVSRYGAAASGPSTLPPPVRGLGTNEPVDRSNRPENITLLFQGPKGEVSSVPLGRTLWQSGPLGISIHTVRGDLPKGALKLQRLMSDAAALGELEPLGEFARPEYGKFQAAFSKSTAKQLRPVISAGTVVGRKEITLSLHHFVGRWQFEERPRPWALTDIAYTQISLPGSSGSPVFDVESGEVVAIHLIRESSDCETQRSPLESAVQLCLGAGTSIPRIIKAIAADVAKAGAPR